MSEEAAAATEVTETPAATEAAPEQPAATGATKPPGYEQVDLTSLPEDVQQRFHHLYKQVKDQKRTERSLREFKEIAAAQSARLEELTTGFVGMADHLEKKSFAESEASLTQAMQTAWEAGNTAAYIDAQNKLIDLKADKKLNERERKAAPPKAEAKPRVASNAAEIANQGYEGGEITQEDQQYINSWQDEQDEGGNMLRPWAHNRSADPDNPDQVYLHALRETYAVFNHPRFMSATMDQKMAEVDRRMGTAKRTATQNVMGANLTGGKKSGKLTLTPEQIEIATRFKFGGPKAKSDDEHLAAYRAQLDKSQSKKGNRQ